MAKFILALAFAAIVQGEQKIKKEQMSKEAIEKMEKEQMQTEKVANSIASYTGKSATAVAMKTKLETELQPFIEKEQQKQEADQKNRESRWANILHKQQQSLLQHEQSLKIEQKELEKMQREKEWKKSEANKQQTEVDACAGQTSTVRAFISSSESHASCLKTQLGACITTDTMAALDLKCEEPSAGWQKKCLAEKAQQMADCAPNGVDWNAMRQGEKGVAADNAALKRLSEWCTFHRTLGKIDKDKEDSQTPFSLILNKDTALSKDAVQKLSDFGANFRQQEWDLLQVDPVGTPAALHSVLVKTEAAGKIQQAMSQMKAVPLDKMPKAINDAGTAKAISWTAGVSGMLERESQDCSLQSPALLKPKEEGKLVAALR